MDESNPHEKLNDIARQLSLSSRVCADSLAQLARHNSSIEIFTRSIAKQLDVERALFGSTSSLLNQINKLNIMSPNIQSLVSANTSLTRMIEGISIHKSALAGVFADQGRIQDMIKGIGLTDFLTAAFARIDTTRMLSASLAAQVKLANLDNLSIGRLLGIDDEFRLATTTNLGNLTHSYQSLIDVAATRVSLTALLPMITTYPPVEYYREIEVLESVTIDEVPDQSTEDGIETGIADALPAVDGLLAGFDDSLCRLLIGARQSLESDNPDRARHVTTSVRELLTQVLHALAPDDQIRQWTANEELFHDNRPTRRARLLFICRDINCDPLTRFVEDDVRAALSFIDSLNSGTHVVESRLTLIQLRSIVSRMESLLVFLLKLRNPD